MARSKHYYMIKRWNVMLKLLIKLNIHGKRHKMSGCFIDLGAYEIKKEHRDALLADWMHSNGIGA